jgi:hypothetical protein
MKSNIAKEDVYMYILYIYPHYNAIVQIFLAYRQRKCADLSENDTEKLSK